MLLKDLVYEPKYKSQGRRKGIQAVFFILYEVLITILSHNCHNILFMPLCVIVFLVYPVDAQTQVTAIEHFISFRRSPVSSHFFS